MPLTSNKIVLALFGANLLVVLTVVTFQTNTNTFLNQYATVDKNAPGYYFNDPDTAYLILKELDVFVPVRLGYTPAKARREFNKPLTGLKPDFKYCDKHRRHFTQNPDFIFKEKNFLTTYWKSTNLRKTVIPSIGRDMMPHINMGMKWLNKKAIYDMGLDATTFYFFNAAFYNRQIGTQFSCLTQMSNHIPGHDNLYRKDRVGSALVAYTKKYSTRSQCFDANKFFPRTWLLSDKEQCLNFFKEFNSDKYQQLKTQRKIVYFKKIGANAHRGEGVFPVNEAVEEETRKQYNNGRLCGVNKNNFIMQDFIHNPFLVNNRKTDFRITMLIASTNPMIVYYHDGFMRVAMHEFNPLSSEKSALITNLNLVSDVFHTAEANGTYHGKTVKQLQDDSVWTFDRIQDYVLEQGMTDDHNWLDNYLRPEIQRMIVHLIRMSEGPFAKRSSLFEIFGIDVMLDGDLNLWFIEANAKPAIEGYSDRAKAMFIEFLKDGFEILYGLLRSRTKRIIQYVNNLQKNGQAYHIGDNKVYIDNLNLRRREFQEVIKNRFEPEFEVKNSFTKIIDDNLPGPERYNYLIEEECM